MQADRPEGASGCQFFVIDEGTADVTHEGTAVASLGPGDHFGEMVCWGTGAAKPTSSRARR